LKIHKSSQRHARHAEQKRPPTDRYGVFTDPANVQQTSRICIQNTRANAGRLLDVCWIV